jgi:predicted transcriptional regulator
MSQLVRVDDGTHERLHRLAQQAGDSMGAVLAKALEAYEAQAFWRDVTEAYAALRADPQAWAEELAERAEWDGTLGDGLSDDPPYPVGPDGLAR